MKIAMITEVFYSPEGELRLAEILQEAHRRTAELAVLPELPFNPWSPATKFAVDDDAEPPGGQRQQMLCQAAAGASIAVLGGVIQATTGRDSRRFNTALLVNHHGELISSYRKTHLPEEEGYWETSHYEPGDDPPQVMHELALPLGVQICSDINRPQGAHLLRALGADLIVHPRATPWETFERWKLVLRATAATTACYVVSVNRPRPEFGVDIGGPSIVVAPTGEILEETAEPLTVVELDRKVVEEARKIYPGYLPERADLWVKGWSGALEKV
jgi:N-carbamoylputrescine amidase